MKIQDHPITENELISLGFRLGSIYETYRIDGTSDGDWFYIQVELLRTGAVGCRVYGESPPLTGAWVCLERKTCSTIDELRELVESTFSEIHDGNQSLIRRAMPLSYIEIRA